MLTDRVLLLQDGKLEIVEQVMAVMVLLQQSLVLLLLEQAVAVVAVV